MMRTHAAPQAAPPVRTATFSPPPRLRLPHDSAAPRRSRHNSVPLLRRPAHAGTIAAVPPIVNEVLASPGRPLDAASRADLEPRFGHDFSQVRIHDDAHAARSARAVQAQAYTVGQDIVFADGAYAPQTPDGRELLAHELAHTVQQDGLQRRAASPDIPTASADQGLEREAESLAAEALARGVRREAAAPAAGVPRPVLSRKAAAKKPKPVVVDTSSAYMDTSHKVTPKDEFSGTSGALQAFDVDALQLPPTKGTNALKLYQQMATAGGLQATLDVSGVRTKAGLWQERAGTDDLRDRWLQRLGWPAGQVADQLWEKAGGDAEFPKVDGVTCQMDHIVELQIGGNNTNENIQVLEPDNNRNSGGAIKEQVFQLAQTILETPELSDGLADQIRLRFKTVKQKGAAVKSKALAVETKAKTVKVPKGAVVDAGTEPYPIRAGGAVTEVQVPAGFTKDAKAKPVTIFDDAANTAAAELVPGFLLETLKRAKGGETIDGRIDDRPKTRLPVTIEDKRGASVTFDVKKPTRQLKLTKTTPNIKFSYPYLSPGAITKLQHNPETGLEFAGYIQTRIPFLGRLDVAYEQGRFQLAKDIKDALKSPLPGTRITQAQLALELWPELKPSGTFGLAIGPKNRELFEATIKVFKDEHGLAGTGVLKANIPGVDKAEGQINYSNGVWSGSATLQADQLKSKLKYVRSGQVTVTFSQGGMTPSGEITFDLPYTNGVTAKVYEKNGRWIFEGDGVLRVPRLDKIGIHVYYDGRTFRGKVKPGPQFKLLGFTGGIDELAYEDGRVTGTGSLEYQKGKAKGRLVVQLLANGKFAGRGDISYQISDNLLVSGSAELDAEEKLRLAGSLKYLKPIPIPHTSFGGDKTLFQAGISIPIPGLSLGPAVGLKARIEGELTAGFQIGPAQLRNMEIKAAFNPLDDNPNLEIIGGAEFYMPGRAYIGGSISAGIMLDLFIGDVSGGLTVRVRADLDGHFKAAVKITYTLQRYSLSADFELMLALMLIFGIDAWLRARAGWGPFSVSTKKTWVLGEKKVNSGLKFGLRAPLRYASDAPFSPPSWDSIEFIKPTIDFGDLLDRVISASNSNTTEED